MAIQGNLSKDKGKLQQQSDRRLPVFKTMQPEFK